MTSRAWVVILAALLIPALTACDDGEPTVQTGDLQVTYQVGSGSTSCEDAGIEFVRVYISISETEDLVDQIFPCEPDDQSVMFNDIEVGTYSVHIEGLDTDNNAIYNGEATRDVTIEANQTNGPVNVVLNQIRPSLQIYFGFADVGGCDRFGVVDIVVRLYEDGVSLVHDQSYPCATQITEALMIEDLSASSTYDLRVRGNNDNDEPTHEYNEDDIVVEPGPPTEISAEMDTCSGLCIDP